MNKRNRWVYLLLAIVVMGAGLLSRKLTAYLPHIVNIYAGDSLWALMIFVSAGFFVSYMEDKNDWYVCYSVLLLH
ncbi:hypothetical protein AS52_01518 [Priestia megaterium Q3]|uniref:Uncharacterized protein n=1 Tax=Priestia megaterium Q3 TaxID=1452722 RepID=A0A806U3C2_PRIMG|nr:hypothetical protein AS52_01518 [Priestia megaterium Q3]